MFFLLSTNVVHVNADCFRQPLIPLQGSVFFVNFSPDSSEENGYTLASGSDDRDVRLWNWRAASRYA